MPKTYGGRIWDHIYTVSEHLYLCRTVGPGIEMLKTDGHSSRVCPIHGDSDTVHSNNIYFKKITRPFLNSYFSLIIAGSFQFNGFSGLL